MTRLEAIAAGLDRYQTDKPCKWGHRDGRYTSTGQCVACARQAAKGQSVAVRHAMLAGRNGLSDVTVRVTSGAHADAIRAYADTLNAAAKIPTFNGGMGIGTLPGTAALIPQAATMGAHGGTP